MTNGQYNAALSLFFVSYAGFEPLTNVLLKRLRPSIFLPAIMVRLESQCSFPHNTDHATSRQ